VYGQAKLLYEEPGRARGVIAQGIMQIVGKALSYRSSNMYFNSRTRGQSQVQRIVKIHGNIYHTEEMKTVRPPAFEFKPQIKLGGSVNTVRLVEY
jgi:hypothetical protein